MTPEAQARQQIDQKLEQAGWIIQDMKQPNLSASLGVAHAQARRPAGFHRLLQQGQPDILWLKNDSLDNLDDLPPKVLQREIIEQLEAALAAFRDVARGGGGSYVACLHSCRPNAVIFPNFG